MGISVSWQTIYLYIYFFCIFYSYRPFIGLSGEKKPSLSKLSDIILGVKIQTEEHSSVSYFEFLTTFDNL